MQAIVRSAQCEVLADKQPWSPKPLKAITENGKQVLEGHKDNIKYVEPEKQKVHISESLMRYGSAVKNSSLVKYREPKATDKYGFVIGAKKKRGPGEGFIGKDEPGWLKKIYTNYQALSAKRLKEKGKKPTTFIARKGSHKKKQNEEGRSDDYLYEAISRREFKRLEKMHSFPYRSCNRRNLVGVLPPENYRDPISDRQERHIKAVRNTPGANRLAKLVQMGNVKDVKDLLKSKLASIHSVSRTGESMLHVAATHGHIDMVIFLLKQGADRGMLNDKGRTAYQEIHAIVEKQGGVYHDKRLRWIECEALLSDMSMFEAAKKGEIRRIKWLLTAGQNKVHDKNPYGMTALHVAAMHNNYKAVKFLVQNGADPTIRNNLKQDCFDMTSNLTIHDLMNEEKILYDKMMQKKKEGSVRMQKKYELNKKELKKMKEVNILIYLYSIYMLYLRHTNK